MDNTNLPAQVNNTPAVADEVNGEVATDNTQQIVINSVRTETRSDKIALLNALDSADYKVVDFKGKELTIKGVFAETHYSNKKQQPVCRVLLIDVEGKSYATGSFVFMNSLKNIISIIGDPTEEEPLKIRVESRQMDKGEAIVAKVIE